MVTWDSMDNLDLCVNWKCLDNTWTKLHFVKIISITNVMDAFVMTEHSVTGLHVWMRGDGCDVMIKVSSHKIHSRPCLCLSVQQSSDLSIGLI